MGAWSKTPSDAWIHVRFSLYCFYRVKTQYIITCFQWNNVLLNQHLGLVLNNKINKNHTIFGLFYCLHVGGYIAYYCRPFWLAWSGKKYISQVSAAGIMTTLLTMTTRVTYTVPPGIWTGPSLPPPPPSRQPFASDINGG